ncbi:MAG TPA: hypothetical protein OIM28_01085 [Clostridiaceae bacterium]|nr:unknown [Clostridium sp. CAG:452]HJJ03263.1 hypothetical protein [Clostridiaceae bacterium]
MNICYISETHETCDFVKRIVIKIKKIFNIVEFSEDNGKTTITLPLFKSNKIRNKKIIKIAKRINKKLYDNNIENVVLSNYLEENEILKQKLYCQNINILDGRYLFYLLIPEIIEYILKRQKVKLQNGEVTLLINDFTQNNAKIITYIAQNVKRVNIVTNHSNKFKKIEDYLYNELGVILNITNNKSKSLSNANIIINIDFPEEIINKYEINSNAIIVNIFNEIKIRAKKFNGININYYKACIPKEYQIDGFQNNLVYESSIYKCSYENARKDIIANKIRIKKLVGINGDISENEFCKNLKYNT